MTAASLTGEISRTDFRGAMAALAAPVTVVTCYAPDGRPEGMTVSAVASASLDPPLLLVALDRGSRTGRALVAAGSFCVNVLGSGQQQLAAQFAGPGDRFASVILRPGPAPVLEAADLSIQCAFHSLHDGGDHLILLGQVRCVDGEGPGGLVWHQRAFTGPASQ